MYIYIQYSAHLHVILYIYTYNIVHTRLERYMWVRCMRGFWFLIQYTHYVLCMHMYYRLYYRLCICTYNIVHIWLEAFLWAIIHTLYYMYKHVLWIMYVYIQYSAHTTGEIPLCAVHARLWIHRTIHTLYYTHTYVL